MALIDHLPSTLDEGEPDHFEFDEKRDLCFPFAICAHRHGLDTAEPCRTCAHNANAIPDTRPVKPKNTWANPDNHVWYRSDHPNGEPQYVTSHNGWQIKVWKSRVRWRWEAAKDGEAMSRSGYVRATKAKQDALRRTEAAFMSTPKSETTND